MNNIFHPQLERFRKYVVPVLAINSYLYYVYLEAKKRNYNFDINKIDVTKGQIEYEFFHLCKKLKLREPERFKKICKKFKRIKPNPIFYVIKGDIEKWESYNKVKML